MHRFIIFIINPISGTSKKLKVRELIEEETAKRNIPFTIFPSVADGDYSFLHAFITEKKVTDIVIAGGDGTVSQVVNSLMSFDVRFGIIPCGSGNGLAYAAGINKQTLKALKVVYDGYSQHTDGFMINDQFACMLCGLGFDARVAHDFAQQPSRGLATYVKQVVKNFLSASPYAFELKVHNQKIRTDAFLISIANSNQFGNNFTIAPSASLSDGLLDIVIVTPQSKVSLLLQTFKQISGRNKLQPETLIDTSKAVIYFQTDKLSIKNLSEAPLHIDGDPAETPEKVLIQVRKQCFQLLQPRPA